MVPYVEDGWPVGVTVERIVARGVSVPGSVVVLTPVVAAGTVVELCSVVGPAVPLVSGPPLVRAAPVLEDAVCVPRVSAGSGSSGKVGLSFVHPPPITPRSTHQRAMLAR